jgi:hypothetical protein
VNNILNNSSGINNNPPITPNTMIQQQQQFINQQPIDVLSEKDREIYHRNNVRLQALEKELRDIDSFGLACDELIVWLNDDRAFNKQNEQALLGCIITVYENYNSFGKWSGSQILRIANERCSGFSEYSRSKSHVRVRIYLLSYI